MWVRNEGCIREEIDYNGETIEKRLDTAEIYGHYRYLGSVEHIVQEADCLDGLTESHLVRQDHAVSPKKGDIRDREK